MKIFKSIIPVLIMTFTAQSMLAGCSDNTPDTKIKQIASQGYKYDTFEGKEGTPIDIIFIKHGSLMIDVDNYLVYIDPVGMFGNDFTKLPKADAVLVTHDHHDHYDKNVIDTIRDDNTRLIMSGTVRSQYGAGDVAVPGEVIELDGNKIKLETVPAYNNSADHLQFHPADKQYLGFIFTIDGKRIYVAGDTEDIPEMAQFKDVDVAFLPVNQPYTMTPQQAIHAVEMLLQARNPEREGKLIVYPYHYGNTDLTALVERFSSSSDVEIRLRSME